jgi:hypothetical protein
MLSLTTAPAVKQILATREYGRENSRHFALVERF